MNIFLERWRRWRGWAWLLVLLGITWLAWRGFAAPSTAEAERDRQIEQLLQLTSSAELVVADVLRNVELSAASAEDKELFRQFATPESLRRMLVPVYRNVLTAEEVAAWLRFYETAPGRSIAGKQARLFGASKEVFLEWGSAVAVQVQNEKARRAVGGAKP